MNSTSLVQAYITVHDAKTAGESYSDPRAVRGVISMGPYLYFRAV